MAVKINPRLLQELDGVLGVHVLVEIKSTVELVAVAALGRRLAVLAAEADAELDDLQQVHVALQRLVREAVRAQVADGLRHDAGELRVHGDVGVPLDELADDGHLGVESRRPDVLDLDLCFVRVRACFT